MQHLLLLLTALLLLPACWRSQSLWSDETEPDTGGDTDTDIDVDTDSDADADTDVEPDTDTGTGTEFDEYDTCSNVAPLATPHHSAGGEEENGMGPPRLNDGELEDSCTFTWVHAQAESAEPISVGSLWYAWTAPQTIWAFWIDTSLWSAGPCDTTDGRTLAGGEIQYLAGDEWITHDEAAGHPDDWSYVFDPPIVTAGLRLRDVKATDLGTQLMHPIVFEWEVYSCVEDDAD